MKATIGRIVHVITVTNKVEKILPALVVGVYEGDHQAVDVQMFSDRHAGHTFVSNLRHETAAAVDPAQDMFWIWPPREA